MTYGLTPTGFYRKDFLTCYDEILAKYQERLGNDIKQTGDSIFGNLIGIQAEREAIHWEQEEAVYLAAWLQSASDEALDNNCALARISRIPARYSRIETVELTNNSSDEITIPSGSLSKQSTTGTNWQTIQDVVIPANSTVTTSLRSSETGDFTAEVGSIDTIISLISGWSGISNTSTAIEGRDRETDAELRLRAFNDIVTSKGGVGSAIANILRSEVAGVTYVAWQENDTDSVDGNGLLPHSLHFVVVGGTDNDIAVKISNSKPGGIATNGDVSVTIVDDFGNSKAIKFDRAYDQAIYFIVNIAKNAALFPANGSDLVKKFIVDYGKTLGNGDKVINHYISGSLNPIPGIDALTIYQGTSPSPGSSANITISSSNRANILSSNIVVNIS